LNPRRKAPPVIDILVLALTLSLFAAAVGFVRLCDRI
jgi:hypothetical protein